jgi:hypothetical protein
MGLRFRKSFKLAPGFSLNIGKRSASVRVGGRGFGLTTGTAGSRATVGAPGTGLSYSTRVGSRRRGSAFGTTVVVAAIILGLIIWVL